MHSKFPKKYNCLRKSTDPQEIDGCSSNTSLILNKQSIHIHNHRQCWCQQYSIDVSMGTAPINPQPVNITSSESINWSKRPWRQFTINYSAVCGSLEQTETKQNTNNTHTRCMLNNTQQLTRLFPKIPDATNIPEFCEPVAHVPTCNQSLDSFPTQQNRENWLSFSTKRQNSHHP